MTNMSLAVARDARRSLRYPTDFGGLAVSGLRSTTVGIVDLSRHGARLRGHDLPATGTRITVAAFGLAIDAQIVWRSDHECGVDFVQPIEPLAIVRYNRLMPVLPATSSSTTPGAA